MSTRPRRETADGLPARYGDKGGSVIPDVPDPPPETQARRKEQEQEQGSDVFRVAARSANGQLTMTAATTGKQLANLTQIDRRITELAASWFEPAARISIFVIYFWFGILKVFGLSPATPLASALTSHTIGMQYFNASFKSLAVYECVLGLLFLIPALTRISVVLLVIHLGIVSSPLVIVANVAWTHPLVPTLEGQYIIKDLAILALGIGLLAQRRLPANR
jgi:uncharacterized membrane protein YphA (DoxX/SURF4 family)